MKSCIHVLIFAARLMLSQELLHLVVSHEPARCEDAGVGAPDFVTDCSTTGLSLVTDHPRQASDEELGTTAASEKTTVLCL